MLGSNCTPNSQTNKPYHLQKPNEKKVLSLYRQKWVLYKNLGQVYLGPWGFERAST
jgi:hypothetical protein